LWARARSFHDILSMEGGLLNRVSLNLRVVTLRVQDGKLRKLDKSKPSKCKNTEGF